MFIKLDTSVQPSMTLLGCCLQKRRLLGWMRPSLPAYCLAVLPLILTAEPLVCRLMRGKPERLFQKGLRCVKCGRMRAL